MPERLDEKKFRFTLKVRNFHNWFPQNVEKITQSVIIPSPFNHILKRKEKERKNNEKKWEKLKETERNKKKLE